MYRTIIDISTAQSLLNKPDVLFIDCRFSLKDVMMGKNAYLANHIPGAVYADLDHDLSSAVPVTDQGRHPLPAPDQMRAIFGRLGISTTKQVILYDNFNHAFASRMWWMLRYMGHEAAAVLDGGWTAWIEAGLPIRSGEETNVPDTFDGEPQADWLVQIADVAEQKRLIDSRSATRYRGEVEPIDSVAGHIPGATNYFYGQHLNTDGRFISVEQIRSNLEPVLDGMPVADATFYCGSGVSACVNLLAAAHAGLGYGKLFVGSWSEWSRLKPDEVETSLSS